MEKITSLSQLDMTKQYTYTDYLTWWFDDRVELIKGYILKMAAPLRVHQKISYKLLKKLSVQLNESTCDVYHAPFDVRFPKKYDASGNIFDVVQPDICVICDSSKLDDRGCVGAPDLIIEILSEGNRNHDLKKKYLLYEEHGVKEYWIVFPNEKMVEVYTLIDNKYNVADIYELDEEISSGVINGFNIRNNEIFS